MVSKTTINIRAVQTKSKTQKYSKDNLYTNNKVNPEADYFVLGPKMETDRVTSHKISLSI